MSGNSPPFHVEHKTAGVSRETEARLRIFAGALLRWNARLNLIGAHDEANLWSRHIEDSVQLAELLDPGLDRAIDLGSGAGFPGLVLAIATGVQFELIEADNRKAAFLREAIRLTGAPATVHAVRIETSNLPPARLLTARALAPLPKLLSLAAPFLAPDGCCLFLKGRNVRAELTHAAEQWHMQADCLPSRTDPQASILRISHLRRVASTA